MIQYFIFYFFIFWGLVFVFILFLGPVIYIYKLSGTLSSVIYRTNLFLKLVFLSRFLDKRAALAIFFILSRSGPLKNHLSCTAGLFLDRSFMVDPLTISRSSQCSTTGVTKAGYMLSRHIKEPFLLIGKSCPCDSSDFPLLLSEWSFTMSDAI